MAKKTSRKKIMSGNGKLMQTKAQCARVKAHGKRAAKTQAVKG